ncbi:ATP-dependent helicase [Pontiellaceae bacterium B12227]|nr:ATP-dependent helicase [Pontiellaceae bacterium B12227]
MNFEAELNEEQLAAVTAPDGPALVVAAAGTGKTRTLIYRLAYLVKERNVQPWEVLLLTFTNKAAKEMIERASTLIESESDRGFDRGMSGTFHSFANRLLRKHAGLIGFGNDFSILDSDDSKKLVRSCMDDLKVEKKNFPKPEVILSLLGVTSGRMGDLGAAVTDHFELTDVNAEQVIAVLERYNVRKKEQNAMDFDDLLAFALKLLDEHEEVRSHYQNMFRYVLVDEYQDTNAIQEQLVRQLVSGHGNLMVVGDDFQSIYSWRGADYRNFLDFEKRYPDATTYKLQTNYRSTPEILDVANSVIAGNPEQFQKELQPVRASLAQPHYFRPRDGSVQARYVIEKAKELNRKGMPLSEICVLYRSHFHAMELQMELSRASLPYMLTSGVRFFEQAHIKDVCTTLKLIANPSDEMAFTRLVEMFPKVGPKTALKIFRKFGGRCNFQHEETLAEVGAALPKAAQPDWEKIAPVFAAYRGENLQDDPGEVIHRFVKEFYSEYMVENFDNHKHRQEDIDGLIDFTAKFETTEEFLSEIALQSNVDGEVAAEAEAPADAIRLSTVHQAKGLEWKAVFILFACEDMFPSKKAAEESGDAEERRLFYVAVTRAEDELFICAPLVRRQRDGGIIFLDPSRFIAEIPPEMLDEVAGFSALQSYSSSPAPSYRPKTPPKPVEKPRPRPASTTPTWERERPHSCRLPIDEFTFSKGAAEVELAFDQHNLPGLTKSVKQTIRLEDPLFDAIHNSLKEALRGKTIALTVSISFNAFAVTEYEVTDCDLKAYMESRLEHVLPAYLNTRLESFEKQGRAFVDTKTLLEDCEGIESQADLLEQLAPDARHAEQVNHLAKEHLASLGPIHIGTAADSVLCLLGGEQDCFFVWEIFDADLSTYLWKSTASLMQLVANPNRYAEEMARVVEEIKSISAMGGRTKYKASKPANFSHFKHDYDAEGFDAWLSKLNQQLGRLL